MCWLLILFIFIVVVICNTSYNNYKDKFTITSPYYLNPLSDKTYMPHTSPLYYYKVGEMLDLDEDQYRVRYI